MTEVFGHTAAREALEAHLPPVVLLRGPASVGKWTLAEHLVRHHGLIEADTRRIEHLTPEAARDLIHFASTAPFGKRKVVLARLDTASESSLNTLLKLLEEPPPTISFILTSVRPTLDTITSRSHVHRLGLLTEEELTAVLMHKCSVPPGPAAKAARLGRGQVQAALTADQQNNSRAVVLSILKAIKDGDHDLLEQAASKFDDAALSLLQRWVIEAITGRWQAFTDAETFGLTADPNLPRKMMLALRLNARPRLVARVALDPLLVGRRPNQ